MNELIKVEIWNDNVFADQRIGTHYFKFSEIKDKVGPVRWINFYGPHTLNSENDYSALMTLEGEKGSTYRGRLLCSIES